MFNHKTKSERDFSKPLVPVKIKYFKKKQINVFRNIYVCGYIREACAPGCPQSLGLFYVLTVSTAWGSDGRTALQAMVVLCRAQASTRSLLRNHTARPQAPCGTQVTPEALMRLLDPRLASGY